ncbi:MAG TPA: HIT family protein [Xanthomonadaceae bacterium]|nr:HIT family protein [Xanthomonadaceae bacterium]
MNEWRLDARLADDTHPVAQLPLCELRLMDDSHHPWLILVPRVAGATELIDLTDDQQQALMREVSQVSRLLREHFSPDKLNVAALGNVVPQLHVHVIARHTGDIAWPKPVWGQVAPRSYTPEALVERIATLREGLAGT